MALGFVPATRFWQDRSQQPPRKGRPAALAAPPFRGKARSASGGLHLAAQWAHWPYRAIVWSCTTQPLALAMICWRFSISGS